MKIVIGYDGSDCGNGAIADLRRAGLFDDSEAVVVTAAHVYMNLPRSCFEQAASPEASAAVKRAHALGLEAMADAKREAEDGAQRVGAMFPTWRVTSEASCEPAHRAILGRSESMGADLIVVGSHGRSALGRALLGSVSQQILSAAHCSVRIGRCAIVPSPDAPMGPVRIVLAVDGSPDAATAVAAVAARKWPRGTEVLVLSVFDVRLTAVLTGYEVSAAPWMVETGAGPEPGMDDAALRRVADEVAKDGVTVITRQAIGDPKHVVVDEARAWNADCVVVGAKGHGRVERILIGSVSSYVATHAHCSVEVVRGS